MAAQALDCLGVGPLGDCHGVALDAVECNWIGFWVVQQEGGSVGFEIVMDGMVAALREFQCLVAGHDGVMPDLALLFGHSQNGIERRLRVLNELVD